MLIVYSPRLETSKLPPGIKIRKGQIERTPAPILFRRIRAAINACTSLMLQPRVGAGIRYQVSGNSETVVAVPDKVGAFSACPEV